MRVVVIRLPIVSPVQHGFAPIVVRDAVGDRDNRPHEANLFDLDTRYADVLGEEEVVTHLRAGD